MKTALRCLALALAGMLLLSGCAAAEGILPMLQSPKPREIYAISLHSATGAEFSGIERGEDGGYKYLYNDISYECYLEFSRKLGEEGYALVSAETLEDGTSRAVVSDGQAKLTMDYSLDAGTASVSYPPSVFARDAVLYDDYTEIRDGDQIELYDHVTATVKGWEKVENYYNRSRDSRYYSKAGVNYLFFNLEIDYFRPEAMESVELLRHTSVQYGSAVSGYITQGKREALNIYNYRGPLSGKVKASYAVVISLTDEQMQHPENVSVTFADHYNKTRYVYHFKADDDAHAIPEELIGLWQGKGTPKNGGTAIDLTVRIEPDGSGEYTFLQGTYKESYPFTLSREDHTFSVDIPATSQLGKVEGTYEIKDQVLSLDITTTFPSGRTYSYTALCEKQAE